MSIFNAYGNVILLCVSEVEMLDEETHVLLFECMAIIDWADRQITLWTHSWLQNGVLNSKRKRIFCDAAKYKCREKGDNATMRGKVDTYLSSQN